MKKHYFYHNLVTIKKAFLEKKYGKEFLIQEKNLSRNVCSFRNATAAVGSVRALKAFCHYNSTKKITDLTMHFLQPNPKPIKHYIKLKS
jgi:hypothetical protein